MLRQAKMGVLRAAEATGLSRLLSASAWRRHRLLILCYHGISKFDEHEWGGGYISPQTFRRRMECLARDRYNVLPLSEALHRLRNGTLPDRAVVITFDDGFHDFFSVALPIVESFGYPVTLYLTTYYVEFNRPVFDPMCGYLLWKGRHGPPLEWPEVFPAPVALDDAGRQRANAAIQQFALSRKLSGREKDDLLARLAGRLGIDYQELCRNRVMHLITPEEARDVAARGVDLQYHTHRHRVYRGRERMFAELQDNRSRIAMFTSREPRHFCYTGGFYLPEYPEYLERVRNAVCHHLQSGSMHGPDQSAPASSPGGPPGTLGPGLSLLARGHGGAASLAPLRNERRPTGGGRGAGGNVSAMLVRDYGRTMRIWIGSCPGVCGRSTTPRAWNWLVRSLERLGSRFDSDICSLLVEELDRVSGPLLKAWLDTLPDTPNGAWLRTQLLSDNAALVFAWERFFSFPSPARPARPAGLVACFGRCRSA